MCVCVFVLAKRVKQQSGSRAEMENIDFNWGKIQVCVCFHVIGIAIGLSGQVNNLKIVYLRVLLRWPETVYVWGHWSVCVCWWWVIEKCIYVSFLFLVVLPWVVCGKRKKKWNKGKLTEFFLMNKNVYTDAKGLFSEFETFIGDKGTSNHGNRA